MANSPKLNKAKRWAFSKTKQKVQKQVEDIAETWSKLYIERSQLKGFIFQRDDDNSLEFDQHFAYVENRWPASLHWWSEKDMERPFQWTGS